MLEHDFMISFDLSRRERMMVASLGVLLLIPGVAFAAFARPCPIGPTCALLALGIGLPLIGVVGRFRASSKAETGNEAITDPDQTITHVSIGGTRHARIRCGSEVEMAGEKDVCSDCFARVGKYHALGCDLEECPRCHRQMISCGCGIEELRNV